MGVEEVSSAPREGSALPLGEGRLEAFPLTNVAGDHALLIRQGDAQRALLTGERPTHAAPSSERDRIVLVPLDEDVELRVDGDAMAVWLARGSVGRPSPSVPGWANAIGYLVIVALALFVIVGGATVFGWLFSAVGLS
jgi:hypothetical protein